MSGEVTLKMLLLGEDKGAGNAIRGVAADAEHAESRLHSFGKIAAGVFTGLAGGAAFTKVGDFLKDSVSAAVDDQAAQRKLALALHNTTGANKEQISSVQEWIDKQSMALGLSKDDIMPAFQRLAETSHSVKKAQQEMGLAFNASAGTGKSLASVTQALAKANLGSLGGLGRLGIKTKDFAVSTVAVQKAQIAAKSAQDAYNTALGKYGKNAPQTVIAAQKLAVAHEAVGKAEKTITGTSLTLNQVLGNMAKTFHGQAEARAHSLQGEMDRLHTTFHELEVKVGYALIPVLVQLGSWFLDKGIPAAEQLGGSVIHFLAPAFDKVKSAVQDLQPILTAIGQFLEKNPATVKAFAITLGIFAVAAGVVTGAMAALDAVMSANPFVLVAVAVAALVAAFVYAYTHSEKFRAIIQGTMRGVGDVAKAVGGFFAHTLPGFFESAWSRIKAGASVFARFFTQTIPGAVNAVLGFIRAHWPLIVGILTGPIGLAVAEIAHHWSAIVGGARAMVGNVAGALGRLVGAIGSVVGRVVGAVGRIVSSMLRAFNGLPGELYQIGVNVMQGLINGIGSMIGNLASTLGHAASSIPGKFAHLLGIASPSKVMFQMGLWVMQGLSLGLSKGTHTVSQAMSAVDTLVATWKSKLASTISTRDQFASGFSAFSTSIFGASYGTDKKGNPIAPTAASIVEYQKRQAEQARKLNNRVHKLLRMGLSNSLIQQMQQAGSAGLAEINALALHATPSQIRQLNAANRQTYAFDQRAGMVAANALYGGTIQTDAQMTRYAKILAREMAVQMHPYMTKGEYVTVTVDGQQIITAVNKTLRTKGKKPIA